MNVERGLWNVDDRWKTVLGKKKKKGFMFVENVENFHEIFFTLLAAIISWLL